jgi:hypothetical protein
MGLLSFFRGGRLGGEYLGSAICLRTKTRRVGLRISEQNGVLFGRQ